MITIAYHLELKIIDFFLLFLASKYYFYRILNYFLLNIINDFILLFCNVKLLINY
jgi:hypothetical protein